jgi:hypothetical protein
MTATRSGSRSASLLVVWSELTTRTPSISMPGMDRGTEPEHTMVARPRSVCADSPGTSTTTAPSSVSRP